MSWWDLKDITRNLSTIKNQISSFVVDDDDSLDPDIKKEIEDGQLPLSEKCSSCQSLIDKLNKDTVEFKNKIRSLLEDRKMILESQEREISQLKASVSYSSSSEFSEELKRLRIQTAEQAALISELNEKIGVYSSTNKALSDRVREVMSSSGDAANQNDLRTRYEKAIELLHSADKCLEMCEKEAFEKCGDFRVSDLRELFLYRIKNASLRNYLESKGDEVNLTDFVSEFVEFIESTISSLNVSSNEKISTLKSSTDKKVEELEKRVSELKASRKDFECEINRLKTHLMDIEDRHNAELGDLSKSYTDVNNLLKSSETSYKVEMEKATSQLCITEELLDNLRNENAVLTEQNTDLLSNLEASKTAVAKQSMINEELHKALQSIKAEHDTKHDIISKRFESDKKSIEARLREELLEQKSLSEQYSVKISALQNELKSLRDMIPADHSEDFEIVPKEVKVDCSREELVTTLELLRNVICTYRKCPPERKSQVYHLLCDILGLEKVESNTETSHNSSLLGYIPIVGRFITTPSEQKEKPGLDDSLSNLLIDYLEKESAKGEAMSYVSIEKLRGMINEIEAVPYSLEQSKEPNAIKSRLGEIL